MMLQNSLRVAAVTIAVAALTGASPTRAMSVRDMGGPTAPTNYSVTAGYGNDDYAANIFSPGRLLIYVGDTVTWHVGGTLEPHEVFFGPAAMAASLADKITVTMPQQGGPPIVALNPQIAFATPSTTYDGTGVAHSGFMRGGGPQSSWSLTFSKAGTYQYWCLVHYDPAAPGASMGGEVVVLPRPVAATSYTIRSGYDDGTQRVAADFFLPGTLTIHVGDTVVWTPGFHTVAFGPRALLAQLKATFIIPKPQPHGPPLLTLNPRVVFPSGGTSYDGMGFVNSGLLTAPSPHSFSLTFTKAGTYPYVCLIHPGMDGTIVVLPAGS